MTTSSNVRLSIEGWEHGLSNPKQLNQTFKKSDTKVLVTPPASKYANRETEAKAYLQKAKGLLNESRNLRGDIKTGLVQAVDRLYQLVKEAETQIKRHQKSEHEGIGKPEERERKNNKDIDSTTPQDVSQIAMMETLMKSLREHSHLVTECKTHTLALTDQIKSLPVISGGIEQNKSYAQATSKPKYAPQVHSIVVSREGDSSGEVVEKIRTVVNAREAGIKVERLRKARDQKVVIGCSSREELAKVTEKIRNSEINLQVEEIKNKDPQIILKDVLSYNTDDDIVAALRNQNSQLIGDILPEEQRLIVKYRRKTRNPHVNHVIMQVAPAVWQRLTTAERVHIDLQRIRVEDRSPLVQCSLCLGYGHGRKFCKETIEKCSHCGGSHMRAECEEWLAGVTPTCTNCTQAKMERTDHNAFSGECPVRRRWDALARSAVAYC